MAARRAQDPIVRFTQTLTELGAEASELMRVESEAMAEMELALAFARASPWPSAAAALTDVQDSGASP